MQNNIYKKGYLLFLYLLGMSIGLVAQKKISYDQACADIDYYFAAIDSIHPNMYWHTPKTRIDSFIGALKTKLRDSVEVSQLGYELLQTRYFWDYHTRLNFSLPANQIVFPAAELSPSGVFWKDKKILSVNGVKIEDILSVVFRFRGCDMPLATFCYYYPYYVPRAIHGMGIKPPFEVVYKKEEKPEKVEGIPYGKLQYKGDSSAEKILDLQVFPADSIAIIYFNECTRDLAKADAFLSQAFRSIRNYGVKNLFIDVSRNPGGVTMSAELFLKYIHFDNNMLGYYQWVKRKGKEGAAYPTSIPEEQPGAFKGNIFVYQSYATCSAGPWIGEFLRAVARGVIVGTPTEATLPIYIDSETLQLPHSKLYLDVATKYFYQEEPHIPRTEWGGIKPDLAYPFLTDRRLSLEDCQKILKLKPEKVLKHSQTRLHLGKYGEMVLKQGSEAVSVKNYRQAIKYLQHWVNTYNEYPKDIRQLFKDMAGHIYYNLACYESLQKEKQKALEAFEKALEYGWDNYTHARSDKDLDFIRNEAKFEELMQTIRAKGDWLYILQQSGGYVRGDKDCKNIQFSYMSPLDPHLVRVRRHFNLDSIAGQGDEISRIKNLMLWVHNTVRYDGSGDNPVSQNAIDMVELCRKENRGVNHRMMALILNECYLAMGFKARVITCLPKVFKGNCHIVNSVFSDSLQKWIAMDPSSNAYLTDENGVLLGIAEVRERLREGLPLVLNNDANLNGQKWEKDKYLRSRLTKHLYWFSCALRSEYDAETEYEGKVWGFYVGLLPEGYQFEGNYKTDLVTYDDECFWQTPDKELK